MRHALKINFLSFLLLCSCAMGSNGIGNFSNGDLNNSTQICDKGECLVYSDWAQKIDDAIHQQAVGFSYAILDRGQIVAENSFGLARTSTDGPAVAMTADLRMDIASVSKTLTTVAALKLLAAKQISLDSPIYPYLPQSWTFGPNVQTITFKELMTHTSGLRSNQDLATGYTDLQNLIAQGIKLSNKVYHYQNHNFALFRILIPYINGFDDSGVSDIGSATSQLYLQYMQGTYGSYFGVSFNPAEDPTPGILSYPFPAGSTPGIDWGDLTQIGGGGGLQLSVHEMATFLDQLYADSILSSAQLSQMLNEMLGWDYVFNDTQHGSCIAKNGGLGNGSATLSTLIVFCPDTGLGFVGLTNSSLGTNGDGSPTSWDDIVPNAYSASWKPQ